jgi:alkylation response protein AidB-like acyl-CoA dehydrogenase
MNFDFSDEQKMLRDEVRKAFARECPIEEVRSVLEGRATYSKRAWATLSEQGIPGAAIPAEFGGLGLGVLELAVASEEAGRVIAPVPLLTSVGLAAGALLAAGSDVQKTAWLPKLASGDCIGTVPLWQGDAPLQLANGRVTGRVAGVPDGEAAGLLVTETTTAGGESRWVCVDLSGAGVTRTPRKSIDPTRPIASLAFESTPADPLGADGAAPALRSQLLDRAAVLLAFEQIGGADRAFADARAYVMERRVFGRPVGSYQAVKHRLVDLFAVIELARVHVYYAAWALDTNAPQLPVAAAAARVAATQAYLTTAREALHLHGGLGYTWEANCHLHYRRSRWAALALGAEAEWRERLVRGLEAA